MRIIPVVSETWLMIQIHVIDQLRRQPDKLTQLLSGLILLFMPSIVNAVTKNKGILFSKSLAFWIEYIANKPRELA